MNLVVHTGRLPNRYSTQMASEAEVLAHCIRRRDELAKWIAENPEGNSLDLLAEGPWYIQTPSGAYDALLSISQGLDS
jgi:hypothetical protein